MSQEIYIYLSRAIFAITVLTVAVSLLTGCVAVSAAKCGLNPLYCN